MFNFKINDSNSNNNNESNFDELQDYTTLKVSQSNSLHSL